MEVGEDDLPGPQLGPLRRLRLLDLDDQVGPRPDLGGLVDDRRARGRVLGVGDPAPVPGAGLDQDGMPGRGQFLGADRQHRHPVLVRLDLLWARRRSSTRLLALTAAGRRRSRTASHSIRPAPGIKPSRTAGACRDDPGHARSRSGSRSLPRDRPRRASTAAPAETSRRRARSGSRPTSYRAAVATEGYVSGVAAGIVRGQGDRGPRPRLRPEHRRLPARAGPADEPIPKGQYEFGNPSTARSPSATSRGRRSARRRSGSPARSAWATASPRSASTISWNIAYPPHEKAGSVWEQTLDLPRGRAVLPERRPGDDRLRVARAVLPRRHARAHQAPGRHGLRPRLPELPRPADHPLDRVRRRLPARRAVPLPARSRPVARAVHPRLPGRLGPGKEPTAPGSPG